MVKSHRPQQPVAPCAIEFLFFYICPHCGHKTALIAPTQPALAQCDSCSQSFPILPIDEHTIRFLKIILANGQSTVDPDFV